MKYPQLSAMPSGVQDWLDEQLEARGIDPVVYTRYVLSLLRRDSHPEKGPSKRVRREDCESVRRAAAIECLMSASDQQFGMEKLVDELCIKLQEIKSLTESSECGWQRPPQRRAVCDWPPLAGAPSSGAPQPMGAGTGVAPPTAWGNADEQDTRSAWPRWVHGREADDGDDSSLARLMAKFDQSIEALWSPEPDLPADEPPACDFPPVSPPGSKSHLFIPSGTNITSSIWSDCADDDAAVRAADLDGTWPEPEALGGWTGELEDPATLTRNLEGVWPGEVIDPGNLASNLERAWSGEIIDSGALARNLERAWSGDIIDPGTLARNLERAWSGEVADSSALARNLEGVWSAAADSAGYVGNREGGWPGDVEEPGRGGGEGARGEREVAPGGWAEPEDPGAWAPSWAAALLNHSKQESSFTEVVPKTHEDSSTSEAPRPADAKPAENADAPTPVDGESELEEDLLTSTRTHFKPIRSEGTDGGDAAAGAAAGYADGTTFVIAASLEVLAFRRCQSGTLLLESEAPPAKYREYKEKEPYAGRYPRDDAVADDLSEFVPKFRVSVNEKCCQTEPGPAPSAADAAETDFFFPGDSLAWDDGDGPAAPPRGRGGGHGAWNDVDCSCRRPEGLAPWEQAGAWAQAGLAAIWQAPCGRCAEAAATGAANGGPGAARRLREELSRDGDQLLSDLSYIFLGSDWLHDSAGDALVDDDGDVEDCVDDDDDDDDDGDAPSAEKLQCLSAAESADARPAAAAERETLRRHARSVDAFLSTCLLSALPSSLIVGAELAPWPRLTERKRRHSVCQRSVPEPPCYALRPPYLVIGHNLRPVTL